MARQLMQRLKPVNFGLAAGDCLALFAFVYLGQQSHDIAISGHFTRTLSVTAAFCLPWIILGWWIGGFVDVRNITFVDFLRRSWQSWLAAVPLALLARAAVLDRSEIPTGFMAVTVGVGGLFLTGWRTIYWLGWMLRGREN